MNQHLLPFKIALSCKQGNVTFYRYGVYERIENINTCAYLNEIVALAQERFNDSAISRLVDFHGYPIESSSEVFEKGLIEIKFQRFKMVNFKND